MDKYAYIPKLCTYKFFSLCKWFSSSNLMWMFASWLFFVHLCSHPVESKPSQTHGLQLKSIWSVSGLFFPTTTTPAFFCSVLVGCISRLLWTTQDLISGLSPTAARFGGSYFFRLRRRSLLFRPTSWMPSRSLSGGSEDPNPSGGEVEVVCNPV